MIDERELIKKCLANDQRAIEFLYRTYSPVLYAVCSRYANNTIEAEDLLHDGFLRILKYLSDFRYDGSFEGWMKRVMVTTAINHFNREKKHSYASVDQLPELHETEANAIEKLEANTIIEVISTLPDGYRQVFNLFAVEGYKHKEIAELLNVSENTSKTQYLKARKWLMNRLNEMKLETK